MASIAILARHGQTEWNALGRIHGHKAGGLDEVGLRQASQLAQLLHAEHPTINLIVSSDLQRAQETAEIIAATLGVPYETDERLRECAFGALEGMTREEVFARYGDSLQSDLDHYGFEYDFRPFGGECRVDVVARQTSLLRELRANQTLRSVLVIGHGRSLNNLLTTYWPGHARITENCEHRAVNLEGLTE